MSTTITVWPANTTITVDDLPARLAAPDGGVIWADITGPTDDDVAIMHDAFHFHPLAIEDTRNVRQRPKIEEYPDYLFLILNPVSTSRNRFSAN